MMNTESFRKAVRALKREVPGILVITDVCLCEYTSNGHCGILKGDEIDNDKSLELIARTALSHVEAGADIVAPSDMMDGRVGMIRMLVGPKRIFKHPDTLLCGKVRIRILRAFP